MSTSIIRLHVFSGAQEFEPPCYLLQIDDFHCLLDCGWDSNFSDEYVNQVAKYAKRLNAVFISHSDVRHLGALSYLSGKCGLNCPIYATSPVAKLGQLNMYDAITSMLGNGPMDKFTLDDVDNTFDRIITMKYQETKRLNGKGFGVSITPYLAGHMLGGAIWKISKDDNEIVYAMDINHKKELHLNGAIFDTMPKPQLLIMGMNSSATNRVPRHTHKSQRENKLKAMIQTTLRQDGCVLFVADTAGRSLELAYMLESMWHNQQNGLLAYGLVYLNIFGSNIIENVQSYIEWMSEKVMQSFEELRTKPFDFRCTRICHTMSDLKQVSDPKVVIVSQAHLNYGIGRQLLLEWCGDKRNLVVLTSRAREKCLNTQLLEHVITPGQKTTEPFTLQLEERIYPQGLTTDSGLKLVPERLASISSNYIRSQSQISSMMEIDDASSSDEETQPNWEAKVTASAGRDGTGVTQRDVVTTPAITATVDAMAADMEEGGSNEVFGVHLPGFDLVAGGSHHHHQTPVSMQQPQPLVQEQHSVSGAHAYWGSKKVFFPHHDAKNTWDEYGEPIDPNDPNYLYTSGSAYAMRAINQELMRNEGLNPGSVLPGMKASGMCSAVAAAQLLLHSGSSLSAMTESLCRGLYTNNDSDQVALTSEDTSTATVTTRTVTFNCSLIYEEIEGLSNGQALKQVLTRLKPHELILVCRNRETEALLTETAASNLGLSVAGHSLHLPDRGQLVNCTKESQIFQARMSDALVTSLKVQRIAGYELSWIEAIMVRPSQSELPSIEGDASDLDAAAASALATQTSSTELDKMPVEAEMPTLEPPQGLPPHHDTIYINEPKLSDLKQVLINQGFNAEFMGGILIVDNCVAIKRSEAGKLLFEGALSSTYYNVRRILYTQFAIL